MDDYPTHELDKLIAESKTATRLTNLMKERGIAITFFEGVGGFSDPANKVIQLGVANKPIQMVEHLVHHIAHCLQERPKVTFKELKQIATSTDLVKFQDSQTAFMMWKCLAPLKVRNSFRAEVGLPPISPETEFYWNPVFGGFKSVLAWNRYHNSPERLAEFIKQPLPDDHLVFLA